MGGGRLATRGASRSSDASSEAALRAPPLGACSLTAIAFFVVSGGPYGIEPLVRTGGAFWSLLALVLVPFVWGAPMALMTAELSSAIPEAGGYVVWVHRALGDFWAFQSSMWTLGTNCLDNSLYPIMFAEYIMEFISSAHVALGQQGAGSEAGSSWPAAGRAGAGAAVAGGWLLRWALAASLILGCTLVNYRGVQYVGKSSVVTTLVVLAPIGVLLACGAPDVLRNGGERLLEGAPQPHWGRFLMVLLWSTGGYDSVGTLAERVAEPRGRTYTRAMGSTIVLSTAVYMLPIVIGVCALPGRGAEWHDGFLVEVGRAVGGDGVALLVTFGGACSAAGLLVTLLCTTSQALASMAHPTRRFVPATLGAIHPRYGTPYVAVLCNAAVLTLLVAGAFETIAAASMLTYNLKLVLEYTSLVVLRVREPDLPRPFRIPLDSAFAVGALVAPPILLCVALVALSDRESLLIAGFVVVLALAMWPLRKWLQWRGGALREHAYVGAGAPADS